MYGISGSVLLLARIFPLLVGWHCVLERWGRSHLDHTFRMTNLFYDANLHCPFFDCFLFGFYFFHSKVNCMEYIHSRVQWSAVVLCDSHSFSSRFYCVEKYHLLRQFHNAKTVNIQWQILYSASWGSVTSEYSLNAMMAQVAHNLCTMVFASSDSAANDEYSNI